MTKRSFYLPKFASRLSAPPGGPLASFDNTTAITTTDCAHPQLAPVSQLDAISRTYRSRGQNARPRRDGGGDYRQRSPVSPGPCLLLREVSQYFGSILQYLRARECGATVSVYRYLILSIDTDTGIFSIFLQILQYRHTLKVRQK